MALKVQDVGPFRIKLEWIEDDLTGIVVLDMRRSQATGHAVVASTTNGPGVKLPGGDGSYESNLAYLFRASSTDRCPDLLKYRTEIEKAVVTMWDEM